MPKADRNSRSATPAVLRYGLSVILVAISLSTTLLFRSYTFRTPLFFPAIILSTWFGGTGPGLLAVVLATLSINFFILEPRFVFSFSFHDAVHLSVFLFSALLISSWSAARRRAEHSLEQARDELEGKVKERTAELTWSNDRFRNLVNTVGGVVWEADAETFKFSFVSDEAERILGFPVEQWLGEPAFWRDHLHPDDRDWAVKFCLNATAQKQDHDFEYRMVAADGRTIWLRDLVTVIVENGRPSKLRGVMVNITKRKLAEEQLAKAEERLRSVIGNTPVILFALDPSGVLTLSEGKGLDAFGLEPGKLVGQSIFDLYHDSPDLHANARRALAGEAVTFVTEAKNQFFEIHLIPLFNNSEGVAGVTGVTYNITDRRRTEKELRLVIDTIPAMSWSTLPDGANDYCSKGWLEYTGMKAGTGFRYGWLDAFHPDDRAVHMAKWRAATETGELFESEGRIRGVDGVYRWFLTKGVPLRDEQGKIIRWYGTNVDIDQRKRTESLLGGEKRLLEMIATGAGLKDILNVLCLTIEEYHKGMLASVLLLDSDGLHLTSAAGPSLPKGWIQQMESLPIGPRAGSCGTAAYRGSPVIASDIATDPLWEVPEHRASALRHGLRASWSNPILSSDGKVLGTFCMYYRGARSPDARDLGIIEMATHLARVAIERDRAEEALRTSEAKYRDLINTSPDPIFVSDEDAKCVLSNAAGAELAGRPLEELIGSSLADTYLPEDRHLVRQRRELLKADGALRFERRFLRRNGEVVPVEFSVSALGRGHYQAVVRDISERKRAEEALRASEQVARGQVEALAQSLDVLATAPEPEKFIGQMLSTIGRLLNAQSVILWLLDDSIDSLVLRAGAQGANFAAADPGHPFLKNPLAWKGDKILQEAVFTGAPVVCEDVETDPRVSSSIRDYFREKGTRKYLTIPTLVAGQVKGFVGIRHQDRPPYQVQEIELAQALAHQAMFAIQLNQFAEQGREAAVLAERNRMARDIHDTLAQGFTGVIMQLEAAQDVMPEDLEGEAVGHLHRAGELARQSLIEARRSVHALRPEALQRVNFWDALKGIIKNTTVGTPVRTTFAVRGATPDFPPSWQENLMHIGQEALTNTLKYAHAHHFETHLVCKSKEVRLEFSDDGDGFKLQDRHDGLGLTGMRERTEQMGGKLIVASSRKKGTKITVILPSNGKSSSEKAT
ncbi:MAG TPA: PAS domain S-box protein [Candidatus Udaeobacter sp.]|nr:PAS domain S-box protein [Candidatus Udaeobacter sp.]